MKQKKNRSGLDGQHGEFAGQRREAGTLCETAGVMPWSKRRRATVDMRSRSELMELLENRVLLSGDHPSMPVPFNTMAPATAMTFDIAGVSRVNGTLAAGDPGDWFRFDVVAPDFVTVLANTAGLGSTANTRVQVFDSSGVEVAMGTDNGEITGTSPLTVSDGWTRFISSPGTYFVHVTSQFNTTGDYQLRVRRLTSGIDPINLVTGDAAASAGVIVEPQGEQVFFLDTPANIMGMADFNSLVTITSTVDLNLPANQRLDTRIEVYDETGAPVPNAEDSDTGFLTSAFSTWRAEPNQRYYVRVRSDRLTGTQATGVFTLIFDFAAQELAVQVDPVTRRGEDRTQSLTNPFDSRLFRFRAEGTGLGFITVRDLGPPNLPPELGFGVRIFDFDGNLLAFDDDFNGVNEPQIEIPVVGGATYFVVVDSFEPPPTPAGAQPFGLFVEASHTFDRLQPVDDHIGVPTGGTPGAIRRQFELATPLTFGQPVLPNDVLLRNGNGFVFDERIPALDRSYEITANATGRIHEDGDAATPADSDLFRFVAPVDMLGSFAGNNDNAGSALYVGGAFTVADPNSLGFLPPRGVENVPSRGLSLFDAASWWFAGPQVQAADGNTLGFNDNVNTPGTAGAEIYAMTVWDPDGPANPFFGPMLVVAGDFTLTVDDTFGGGPGAGTFSFNNIAVWGNITPTAAPALNFPGPTGYSWINPLFYGLLLGSANQPVRALTTFDEDGVGPNPPLLFAGGDFTSIGLPGMETMANRLAKMGPDLAWQAVGTGITGGANPSVRALTVYDPPDPGPGMPPGVPDAPNAPQQLVVGGSFTNAGGTTVNNIAFWGFASDMAPMPAYSRLGTAGANGVTGNNGQNAPGGAATGVYALSVWDPPSDPNTMVDPGPMLVVGGNFTAVAGVAGATNNIALYGSPVTGPTEPMTNPRLLWLRDVSGIPMDMTVATTPGTNPGFNSTVFALATWDPPDFAGQPPVEPLVAVGGAFSMSGMVPMGNFGLYLGTPANQALGNYDGIVRAITVMRNDTQEFGINHFTNTDDDREVLYIGGEFQNVQLGMAVTNASRVVQLDAAGTPGGMAGGFGYSPLRNGVDATVFSLIQFDDTNPTFDDSALLWDRNDRPSSRISITVTPTTDSFLNSTVRIYDGAFNIIYTNDLRDPAAGGTDPSGSFNRALGPGLPNIGPALWGGSTYYIEVIGGGGVRQDGRYNLSVTIDAYPPDINNDGVPDDTVSQLFEAPGEGSWTSAQRLTIDDVLSGDTDNDIGDPATALPVWLSPGNQFDGYSIGSGPGRRRVFGQGFPADVQVPTPSGFFVAQQTDYAAIETIEDTDLYFFRANATGYFEVRINTTNIAHEFAEDIWDYSSREGNAMRETNSLQQTISSPLASLLTIFNNDLQVVTTSSYNPSVQGESSTTTVGTLGERVFWHRDARVAFEVQAGQVYFIQVESAQRAQFMLDPNQVDFGVATGTYELLLNGLSDFNPDNSDDHASGFNPANGANTASPVPIDSVRGSPTNGQGSVIGTIRDVFNSQTEPNNDLDLFSYYATSTGTVRLTGAARNSSTVALSLTVIDDAGMTVVTGAALQGGSTTVTWFAQQGERYFVRVDGAGGSQGDYILNFEGAPDIDDHVNVPAFADGTEVTVNRFLGTITGSGRIENAGDNDVFQFNSSQYVPDIRNQATVRVRSTSPASLDVQVRVYEVQVDLGGNEYRALIGLNDDETDENNPNGPPLSNDAFARFSISPNRTYYIVVEGEDPNVDFGDYNFTVSMNPTDDHPDFVAFPLSSDIALTTDVNVGAIGSRAGRIEIPIDDDVFRFTAQASGMATVTLTQAVAGSFDSVMRIFDSSQTLITSGMGDMSGNITLSFAVARGAAYTIVVDINSGTPTDADYTVSVVSPPNDDHPNEGEFPLASTIFLSSTTGSGTRTGEIRPSGTDTDLFRVTTRVAGALVINLTTPGSNLNPRIQVFNSSFVLLPGSSDDAEGASQTIMASAVNQVFYILVRSDTVGGGDQVGSYTITASQTIPGGGGGGGGGGTDDHANAGNFDGATPIALNTRTGDGTATGIINFVGDTDLFSFVTATFQPGVSGTRPVYLQITTPTGGLVDGTVRVFDDSMAHNVVAMDSNGVPGATANLVFQASPGTRYFVLVEPVASNQGSYVVRLDTEPNTHFLFFPEGFSSTAINEFVPIVNANPFPVTYSLIARYETGERDQVLVSNAVIPANSRGGHTISTAGATGVSLVRRDTPYALEIQSNGQIAATLSHFDFGITTGENFTNQVSTAWTFAEARKDALNFRDFLLFYNPNNAPANLTISLVYDDGQVVTFNRTVEAFRRSGINFTNDTAIPREGRFAVNISSDQGIVSSLTSFRISGNRGGFGVLGNSSGGATVGVLPLVSTGTGVESSISLFNTNTTQSASVTLTATYLNAGLPDLVRVVSIGANSRRTFTMAELGLVPGLQAGLRYQASIPITATYAEYQNGDADATVFGTTASQTSLFGDAFVNPQGAGTTYIENLAIFNPASFETDVTVRFLFNDGSVSSPITRRVGAGGYDVIRVDQQDAILNRPGLAFFSIRVDAISPIVTYFTHFDLFLNGGWSTLGAPVGLTNPVSTIG